jgi:hypothetical protein
MHDTDDAGDSSSTSANSGARWSAPPTAKERGAVQRAVERLLDELAPERATGRAVRPQVAIERHRTPRGCILQATTAAVSVSWFPDAADDAALGELQIVLWRGVVSRPGSAHRVEGATVVRERVLHPVEGGPAAWAWRGDDGTVYDTDTLAAECLAMLEAQITAETAR